MERRTFIGAAISLFLTGCGERDEPSPETDGQTSTPSPTVEQTPTRPSITHISKFGVHPVTLSEEQREDADIVVFDDLSEEEQDFIETLFPRGGSECSSRSSGWDSLRQTLPMGETVYLERNGDLFAIYDQRGDEVLIWSADTDEIEFSDC
jgi:hypothetical protein